MKTGIQLCLWMMLLLFLGSTGCAKVRCWQAVPFPNQLVPVENPSNARIYVMRDGIFADNSTIRDNDTFIGILTAQRYLSWERDPGHTTISSFYGGASKYSTTVELSAERGRIYYIKENSIWPYLKLELLNEITGKDILNKCSPPNSRQLK